MSARTILLLLFTSILLLFKISFWLGEPLSHFSSSPALARALSSIFKHKEETPAATLHIYHRLPRPYLERHDEEEESSIASPLFDEKDVVVLTGDNLTDFISRNEYVMVNFYANWCYWSNKLAPEYAAAATILKKKNGKAVLAKVDCAEDAELARKNEIMGYPTMYLFVGGGGGQRILYDHANERTRDAIATWVNRKIDPHVQTIATTEEATCILKAKSIVGVGFLDTLEGPESEELSAVSKLHMDIDFYQTSNPEVARVFSIDPNIKRPAFFMLSRENANHTVFELEGEFTRLAIADFVSLIKRPSVITFTLGDASHVFENPKKQVWLFAAKYSWNLRTTFKEAANSFRGKETIRPLSVHRLFDMPLEKPKLLFVLVQDQYGFEDSGPGNQVIQNFGITDGVPTVVAYSATTNTKHIYHGELTLSGIKEFARELLEDKLSTQTETLLGLPMHSDISDPTSVPHAY